MEIAYLADHMALAPTLAAWHYTEWRELLPDWPEAEALAELRTHTQRRAIPMTLVALAGGACVGSVSLLTVDHERLTRLSPWLGSLFVLPAWRGQGIGARLVDRAVAEAGALGITRLYLYTPQHDTPQHEQFYLRRGWALLERVTLDGVAAAVLYNEPDRRLSNLIDHVPIG